MLATAVKCDFLINLEFLCEDHQQLGEANRCLAILLKQEKNDRPPGHGSQHVAIVTANLRLVLTGMVTSSAASLQPPLRTRPGYLRNNVEVAVVLHADLEDFSAAADREN